MRQEKKTSHIYIEHCYGAENDLKQLSRTAAEKLGLDGISISQTEARMIQFFVQMIKPQKIVEIGTLTGLSCQYFLEALQTDGIVYSLEKSEEHFEISQKILKPWIDRNKCQLILGDAREKLKEITSQGPFDAIFIDGNKSAYLDYWHWAEANIKKGGLIIIDNVFLSGSVWDGPKYKFSEKQIQTMKTMTDEILKNSNFQSSFIPTDEGLLLALKK